MKPALFAVILIISLCLCSCGLIVINKVKPSNDTTAAGGETSPYTTQRPDETTQAPAKADIDYKTVSRDAFNKMSVSSMSGVRFVVAAVDPTFLTGDGSETVLTADRVERIKPLEEKFDTDISVKKCTVEELYNGVSEAYKSGEYYADLLALPQSQVGLFATDGLLYNLRSVPNFNLNNTAFNKSSVYALSAGHLIFGLTGEGAFEPEKINGMYFNRDIAEQLGLDDIYSTVKSGAWTLDKYAIYVKSAAEAQKRAATYSGDLNITLLLSSGFTFSENAPDKTPRLCTFGEKFQELITLFSSLPEYTKAENSHEQFLAGETLFFIGSLSQASLFKDSIINWGLIPFPKVDESGDYKSSASADSIIFAIPSGYGAVEVSGDFIEALCTISEDYIKYDFLNHNLRYILRDNTSVTNMYKIMESVSYDFSYMMNSGYKTMKGNTEEAFASLISSELTYEEYAERQAASEEYMNKWFPIIYE